MASIETNKKVLVAMSGGIDYMLDDKNAKVIFKEKQRAITKGQFWTSLHYNTCNEICDGLCCSANCNQNYDKM